MFSWDFKRSAEAMFSRWAMKRVCKFLLKKRLGDLILGDIDLDQLDVQLSQGTIQLSDLALNVDFLNQKLAGSAVMVKEGSIASLSVKVPWKLKNCQIEVEELELVLAPFVERNSPTDASCSMTGHNGTENMCTGSDKMEPGTVPNTSGSISLDVHEGVKTIAKFVKLFLTSFHVRLKNVIVAFDPSSALNGKSSAFHRSLVLRIAETEFGTYVLENAEIVPNPKLSSLLGIEKLTNFVKFKGAVIELLRLDDVDSKLHINSDLGTSFSEWYAGKSLVGSTTAILTGASDGFSGKVNLSIPWKNGSLDLRKVDADVSVDPLKLRIQSSTIEWIIAAWESLKNVGTAGRSHAHYNSPPEPFSPNSRIYSPVIPGLDIVSPSTGENSLCTVMNQETYSDSLPRRTHIIQNWVPPLINGDEQIELEPDYGASIDQFFECFDEIRSSQVNSGNSSLWNWTCSVFSAITVASNLASGSGHIPTEQQHVETRLRASIAEVSIILSFHDKEQNHSHDSMGNDGHIDDHEKVPGSSSASYIISPMLGEQSSETFMSCLSFTDTEHSAETEVDSTSTSIHHLVASCQNAVLNLKICLQKTKFDASVTDLKIEEYSNNKNVDAGFGFIGCENSTYSHMVLNEQLQGQVQSVLPPFPYSAPVQGSVEKDASSVDCSALSRDGRVVLLESFGECSCQYNITSKDLNGRSKTSTSFSVHLPPLIFWVHFPLVNMLLSFFKQIEYNFDKSNATKDPTSEAMGKRNNSSSPDDAKSGTPTYTSSLSNLEGDIVLQQARFIICFPSDCHEDSRHSTYLDKFIVLEHSPSSVAGTASDVVPVPKATSPRENCTPSTSIHLSTGDFDIYLVDSASRSVSIDEFCRQSCTAVKILSVINGTSNPCGMTMLWQKGPVTGPWMATRTWSLAKSHSQGSRYKVNRNGCEFSSVTTAEDHEQTSSHIRQELILSSAFFMHVHFSLVRLILSNHDYKLLNHLLNQVMDILSNGVNGRSTANESINNRQSSSDNSSASQASILVDFDVVDLSVSLDEVVEVNNSIQKELPGSWNNLKLRIEKFELLSVTEIGGISNAKFVWFNHGEGELRGSVFNENGKASPKTEDILLITCRNSTIGRGAGEGANALSFGSAGTAITHMWNPQLLESYTSIIVRCGTIVAPGGRLDWINAICLFFSSPLGEERSGNDGMQSKCSEGEPVCKGSFFLDLVDIAVSYEPHIRYRTDSFQGSKVEQGGFIESKEDIGEQYFSCLVAAASLSLSNHTSENAEDINYNVQLQDAGLLISNSSGSENGGDGYHAGYLQKAGYVKIAEEALIQAVLRIRGMLWEIECSDSHIDLGTCHDTTYGLIRLIAQLQQLYAPDMEDALAHLQSRWNTIRQARNGNTSNDMADISDSSSRGSSSEMNLPPSEGDGRCAGLLDEILENAFYVDGEWESPSGYCNFQSHFRQDEGMPKESCNLNIRTSIIGDNLAQRSPSEKSMYGSGIAFQKSSVEETCSDQIIESYYVSKSPASANLRTSYKPSAAEGQCRFDATAQRYMQCGNSGWYGDDSFMIVENHISKVSTQPGGEQLHQEGKLPFFDSDSADQCREKGRIILKNTDVLWKMYAGLDWSELKNSVHCSNAYGRDRSVCLELNLSGMSLRYDIYPEGMISVSKLSVSIQEINLYDRSMNAPWMMVLGYYSSKDHPRESCAKAFKLDLEAVRPEPDTPLEDYRLHLEVLPMRLHLHQNQLNFLISFFGKDSFAEESPTLPNNLDESEMCARKNIFGSLAIEEEALLPFFQKCDIRPVVVRVDYIPRHIDLAALRRGNYAELLNLVSWKGIDLQLKPVCAVGVYGWSSVCETVAAEWLEDISHNQVHKLLKGIAPLKSLSAVSSGTSKLVSLPVKSYRKDHKLLKGMQRGALAFVKSISLEAVGLGVHLAAGAHEILLQAEYILTSIPPSVPLSKKNRARTVRSVQPEDTRQGIRQAYESLSDGFGRTASALLGAPLKAYQRGAGAGSALATVVRAVPSAAIAPVSASARAVHCALLGVRNSLDPERKKESIEKYLGPQGHKIGKKSVDPLVLFK